MTGLVESPENVTHQEMEGLLLNCLANCPNECVAVEGTAWVCSEALAALICGYPKSKRAGIKPDTPTRLSLTDELCFPTARLGLAELVAKCFFY